VTDEEMYAEFIEDWKHRRNLAGFFARGGFVGPPKEVVAAHSAAILREAYLALNNVDTQTLELATGTLAEETAYVRARAAELSGIGRRELDELCISLQQYADALEARDSARVAELTAILLPVLEPFYVDGA